MSELKVRAKYGRDRKKVATTEERVEHCLSNILRELDYLSRLIKGRAVLKASNGEVSSVDIEGRKIITVLGKDWEIVFSR